MHPTENKDEKKRRKRRKSQHRFEKELRNESLSVRLFMTLSPPPTFFFTASLSTEVTGKKCNQFEWGSWTKEIFGLGHSCVVTTCLRYLGILCGTQHSGGSQCSNTKASSHMRTSRCISRCAQLRAFQPTDHLTIPEGNQWPPWYSKITWQSRVTISAYKLCLLHNIRATKVHSNQLRKK